MSSSRSSSSSFVAALAAFVVTFLLTAPASAQTITVLQPVSLPRVDASGQMLAKRPLQLHPEAVNAQDCRDDQRIRFPVRMNDFQANAIVQMWASSSGTDCTMAVNRHPDTGSCWKLPTGDLPLQSEVSVDVPVRAILSPTSDESICGKLDTTVLDVQIMMFEADDYDLAVVSERVAITADTLGPEPPIASVSAGNGRARIDVRSMSDFATVSSVAAFCEKSTAGTCSAKVLVGGTQPDPSRECGSIVGNSGSTFFTGPLENGASHIVGVAARDPFGNLGPLSSVACATPSPDAETKVQSLDEPGCSVAASRPRRADGALAATWACAVFALVVARQRRRAAASGR